MLCIWVKLNFYTLQCLILWVWGICARILCNHNMENNDDNKLSKKIKKKLNIELYIQAALYAK